MIMLLTNSWKKRNLRSKFEVSIERKDFRNVTWDFIKKGKRKPVTETRSTQQIVQEKQKTKKKCNKAAPEYTAINLTYIKKPPLK